MSNQAVIHEGVRRILLRVAGCIQNKSFVEAVKKDLKSSFDINIMEHGEHEP